MTKPELVPTPMPVVLSTPEEVAARFGRGSELHLATLRGSNPQMRVCRDCGCVVPITMNRWCSDCRSRTSRFEAIAEAFRSLGQAMAVVEETARSLHHANVVDEVTWSDCRSLAFRALANLYDRRPDLYPFNEVPE